MREGVQKEVVTAVGFGYDNNMTNEFSKSYINANKEGQDYSALKTEDTVSDVTLRTQIANNTSDIINHFASIGGQESAVRINDFVKSGLNYVKFRAMQSGDLDLSNADKYINEFTDQIGRSYNLSNRRFSSFNISQLPLSDSQQDILQNYVYKEAQDSFMGQHKEDLNFQSDWSKLDISIYNDSTNHIIAVDSRGESLFYAPYSDSLMSAAIHRHKPISLTKKEKQELQTWTRNQSMWYMSD